MINALTNQSGQPGRSSARGIIDEFLNQLAKSKGGVDLDAALQLIDDHLADRPATRRKLKEKITLAYTLYRFAQMAPGSPQRSGQPEPPTCAAC